MKRYWKELHQRKDLLLYLVTSGLKAQHRNTLLGYLWWLLDPLLNLGIYYFVVAVLFKRGGDDYILNLVIGLTVWRWVQSTISSSVRSISSQASVISQVYLPKAIFPIGAVLSQLINFGFGLIVVGAFLLGALRFPNWNALWLPYLVVIQMLFLTALSLAVAFVGVFVRDMDNLMGHLLRVWFYLSPVVWTNEVIPVRLRWLVDLNPMAHFMHAYRDVLLYGRMPNHLALLMVGGLSAAGVVLMIHYYSRNEHRIVKSL